MISPEEFYLHIQGEQRGPYTIPQIDHLLNSGLIAIETLYWREGLDQWAPVTSLVAMRRKKNPWVKPLWIAGIVLVLAIIGQCFGPIVLIGWRETNQHRYTKNAAYWRARGVIRSDTLPPRTVVQFQELLQAEVELQPPTKAVVKLQGDVMDNNGVNRTFFWQVPMIYDLEAQEWTGGPAREITP